MAAPLLPLLAGLLRGGAVEGAVAATGAVEGAAAAGGFRALLSKVAHLGATGKEVTGLSQGITQIFADIAAAMPAMKKTAKEQPAEARQQQRQQQAASGGGSVLDAARKAAAAMAGAVGGLAPSRAVNPTPPPVQQGGAGGGAGGNAGGGQGGGPGSGGGNNQPPQQPPQNPGGGQAGAPGPFTQFILGALGRAALGGGATGAASRIALGGIGAMTTGLGPGIAGALVKDFIDLGKAVVTLPIKIQAWGDELLNSQRQLEQYSGTLSAALQELNATRFRLNVKTAQETAGTTKDLAKSQGRLETALQPFEAGLTNIENRFAAIIEDAAASVVEGVYSLPGVQVMIAWFSKDAGPGLPPWQDFLADLASRKQWEDRRRKDKDRV